MSLSRADVLTQRVKLTVTDGGSMDAYDARPRDDPPAAGVVVAHELFGLTAHVRDVCERLASDGFVALAPDFYHRIDARAELPHDESGRTQGFALLDQLRRDEAIADVGAAIDHLHAAGASRVGIIGLSLGGHIAYLAATAHPIDAVAALYPGWLTTTDIGLGRPEPTIELTRGITGRVLILCGSADHAVPTADLDKIDAQLTNAGIEHEIVTYPDTPHGFLCDRRDTYRQQAANDAWRRVTELFRSTLR